MKTKIVVEKNKFYQKTVNVITDLYVMMLICVLFSINVGYASKIHMILALFMGCALALGLFLRYKIKLQIYFYFFLLLILGFINIIFFSGADLLILGIDIFICFPIALYFVKVDFNCWFWKSYSVLMAIYIINKYLTTTDVYMYQIFPNASRNYISVFLIFAMFLFCIADLKNKYALRNLFFFAIVSFITSIMAIGRGGIIATGLLLVIILIFFFRNNGIKMKILMLFLFLLASYFVLINIEYIADNYFVRFTKDNVSGSNYERSLFVITYLLTMIENPFYLFFGVAKNSIEHLGVSNFHNSYLQFHSTYGLIPLIMSIILFIISLKKIFTRENFTLFAIGICFLVRAGTDMLFPAHLLTIVLYYFCFFAIEKVND